MVSDDVQILHSKKTAQINVKKTFQFITMCKGDESSWTEKQQKPSY